jgi:leader peptidase (prepilin peptidase) / N-methyltransferase
MSPIAGSFVGTVIRRLPDDASIVWDRSRCEQCGAALDVRDLIPLASWAAARGRCRHCGASLGWFYPAVEVLAIAVAGVSVAIDNGVMAWLDALLGWWLLALGWIDLRRWLLPDVLTLPLVLLGLAEAAWFDPAELSDRALGAVCGYLVLRLIAWLYRMVRGADGLGGGDAKLLAAAGAWVGVSGLPSVLAGAACGGLVVAGALALRGMKLSRNSALPFGPFLALATWVVWLFGPLTL